MPSPSTPLLTIANGSVLLPDGALESVDVNCGDGVIIGTGECLVDALVIDATDALVLPGLVDIHGDGFERTLMPRAGVLVGFDAAVGETRSQLLAAGITTAFISVTDGWEPGLRSRDSLRKLIAVLDRPTSQSRVPRLELHVRHERGNIDDLDELIGWIDNGAIRMISYNDHTPGGIAMVSELSEMQVKRSGVDRSELERRRAAAVGAREEGLQQEHQLSAACQAAGVATASHDASSGDDLARDLELGVAIAEFPLSIELARQYREAGIPILLGAPNLVRGQSHLGNLSVRDAWSAGVADLICSDYHYQSLLQAPFVLEQLGSSLGDAWHTVSRGPAEAAGMKDRGRIEPGALADLIVVEPPRDGEPARVRAAVVGGRVASLTP